jgi:hypothetical protein
MNIRKWLLIFGLWLLVFDSSNAHHGFGGLYDRGTPIILVGTVTEAQFTPPHPKITLKLDLVEQTPPDMPNVKEFEDGLAFWAQNGDQTTQIEFPPVSLFFDLASSVKPGDRITVIALRNCNAPYQLRGQWIQLANGKSVLRRGRMQTEVKGCP